MIVGSSSGNVGLYYNLDILLHFETQILVALSEIAGQNLWGFFH